MTRWRRWKRRWAPMNRWNPSLLEAYLIGVAVGTMLSLWLTIAMGG